MERFVEDGSLDDNVESFLSHDDADAKDTVGRGMDLSKGGLQLLLRKAHTTTTVKMRGLCLR